MTGNAAQSGRRRRGLIASTLVTMAVALAVLASSASAMTFGLGWVSYDPGELDTVQHSGATVYRLPLDMSNSGIGNWGFYDPIFKSAWEHGVTIQPYFVRSQAEGTNPDGSTHYSTRFLLSSDSGYSNWYIWAKEAVERYGINGSFWNGKTNPKPVTAWEVWNEPNLPDNNPKLTQAQCESAGRKLFKKPDGSFNNCVQAQNYGAFLIYTAAAAQQGSNNKTGHGTDVLFGGLWMPGGEYYNSFLQDSAQVPGTSTSYSGVSIHPYAFFNKVAEMKEEIGSVRYALDHFVPNGGGKSLWITELGWPVAGAGEPTVSPTQQASLLTESFNWIQGHAVENNIPEVIWYNIRDGGGSNWDGHSGLMDGDHIARPAWKAFKEQTGAGADPPTNTTAKASALNGNPGWVTVEGTVTATDGSVVNNRFVNITLKKYNGSKYAYVTTLHVNVTSGAYKLNQWEGVAPGQWVAKVVFPSQAPFDESSSNEATEGFFTVKDGYRLVAKHSGRCLDVTGQSKENKALLHQWDCLNPSTYQNQVFKLVPSGNNYQLVARHSNRCVSVIGGSYTNGTGLEQYDCISPPQSGQIWQLVPVETSGEVTYYHFVAVHSEQCMDVQGQKTGNDVPVTQWPCLGSQANQLWSFQSVDSAPVPTETFITVPEGETMNGQPGYVTVNGYVKSGAYSVGGQQVEVIYEKEESPGIWSTKATKTTLNNEGFYQVQFEGVAAGHWKVHTKFLGGNNMATSESPFKTFDIKRGYRFVARHSSKCMTLSENKSANGTAIIQWPCLANPQPSEGQTFTLVPQGGGYFEILINSTSTPQLGKCLDVAAGSTADGAAINEWSCGGSTNQQWQVVPIQGQAEWFGLVARHSNKCADVERQSTDDGVRVHQWSCTWTGNQQWKIQAVD